jgi:hypothetical protein
MLFYFLIFAMTFAGSLASVFLKKASSSDSIVAILKNIYLYIGVLLYGISALVNIVVLKKLDYSVVLPLTSITYIWTMFLSCIILKEIISRRKIMGVILVIVGAVFIVIR